MKKCIALLAALMLLAAPSLATGTDELLLAAPSLAEGTDEHIERAQVVSGAQELVRIVAAGAGPDGFTGAPDAQTAWNSLSLYAKGFADDAQVFTQAEMSGLYTDLFAQGGFEQIADQPLGAFSQVQGGYEFSMADGEPSIHVIGNDADTYTDDEIHYDISMFALGHDGYPMYFEGNAVAVLAPSPEARFGARLAAWIPGELPVFSQAQSNARLHDQEGNTYVAENAIDGNLDTCWAYPLAEADQPYLALTADQPQQVRGIVFTPGYAKSAYAFSSNRRVAELRITLSGDASFTMDLPDVDSHHFEGTWVLPFEGVYETDSVTIEVLKTYEGARFDDVCLSEVYMF